MNNEEQELYMVAVGDPFDGITFYGPFTDMDTAAAWIEGDDNTWWVLPLIDPIEVQDD